MVNNLFGTIRKSKTPPSRGMSDAEIRQLENSIGCNEKDTIIINNSQLLDLLERLKFEIYNQKGKR